MDQEMAFVIERKGWGETKAIDRERGIVFDTVPLVDPDGIQNRFLLDWHGQKIYFEGRKKKIDFQDQSGVWKLDLEWMINAIMLPEGFPESRETVFNVICEALDAFGTYYDRDHVNSVKVERYQNAFESEIHGLNKRYWWHELGDSE